jgi:two-component system alkaline phosphatase synthesis response regulator PhoP
MTRIAVVDDDASILSLMGAMATDRGWEVVPSTNSASFFTALEQERPDVVVVDLMLQTPDSGWDALRRLKADPTLRAIPAIVCSGDAYHLHEQQGMVDEYASAVLIKPFDVDDFYRCVEHALAAPAMEPERAEQDRAGATGAG